MDQFVYNPAQSIKASLGETQAGVGNIFAQIAAQKQQDYKLAENVFQNIGALTEKLGKYGQQEIVGKTKNLLQEASSSILKNGKLDYDTIGKIRSQVQDIKSRKAVLDSGAELLKEKMQYALATKDDYVSLPTVLRDLEAPLLNPNNRSYDDIARQMDKAIENNVDLSKVTNKVFSQVTPISAFKQTYETKDGAKRAVEGLAIAGSKYDPSTGSFKQQEPIVITNPDGTTTTKDFYDVVTDQVKQANPGLLPLLRSRLGGNAALSTDKEVLKAFYDPYAKQQRVVQDVEMESAAKRKGDILDVQEKQFKVDTQGEDWRLRRELMRSQINKNNERDGGLTMQAISDAAKQSLSRETINLPDAVDASGRPVTGRQITAIGTDLGKQIKLPINGVQMITRGVYKSEKTGDLWARILVKKDAKGFEEVVKELKGEAEQEPEGAYLTFRKIKQREPFVKALAQTIRVGGIYSKDERPYVAAQINQVLGANSLGIKPNDFRQQVPQESQSSASQPAAPKKYGVYKGYNLDVLLNAKENQGVSLEDLKSEIDKASQTK